MQTRLCLTKHVCGIAKSIDIEMFLYLKYNLDVLFLCKRKIICFRRLQYKENISIGCEIT